MPLLVNVGINRKATKHFQSAGLSINLTAELDGALLARPDQLQEQISRIYRQAEVALDRQADAARRESSANSVRGDARANGSARPNGSVYVPMTDSQARAIRNISARTGIDANLEAREILGLDPQRLSIKDASKLIDHLKSASASAGNGGRIGGGRC